MVFVLLHPQNTKICGTAVLQPSYMWLFPYGMQSSFPHIHPFCPGKEEGILYAYGQSPRISTILQ